MSVILIVLPLALLIGAVAVAAVQNGQLDDLDSPPVRMLEEDEETAQ